MHIDIESTPVVDVYHFLVGLVTPRPIAWVTSLTPTGIVNLAPFSFYNTFGANPPTVVFSPTITRDGKKKDTLCNIESNGQFCINAATADHAELINLTSRTIPPEESEIELANLQTVASTRIAVPRIVGIPFALECELVQIVPIGGGPISSNLVIGRVVHIFVDDRYLGADGRPDPTKIQSIGRMGGEFWCRTSDLFELPRPQ
jgi:flavin reductase (DIM6/NTAB) family NADH-FMN oxidoreductase RutF